MEEVLSQQLAASIVVIPHRLWGAIAESHLVFLISTGIGNRKTNRAIMSCRVNSNHRMYKLIANKKLMKIKSNHCNLFQWKILSLKQKVKHPLIVILTSYFNSLTSRMRQKNRIKAQRATATSHV